MIDLLGVGIPRADNGFVLKRVCLHLPPGQFTAVVSGSPEERLAVLDAAAGRVVPPEGRVWVSGIPLMRGTQRAIRARVTEVDLRIEFSEHRSLLWNTLVPGRRGPGRLQGLLRLLSASSRREARRALARVGLDGRAEDHVGGLDLDGPARLAVARALWREPRCLVLRDVDVALALARAERLFSLLCELVQRDRLSVLASVDSVSLARRFADRIVAIADGMLVRDASRSEFAEDGVACRLEVARGSPHVAR